MGFYAGKISKENEINAQAEEMFLKDFDENREIICAVKLDYGSIQTLATMHGKPTVVVRKLGSKYGINGVRLSTVHCNYDNAQ